MKNYIVSAVLLLLLIGVLVLAGVVLIKGFEYKDIKVLPLLNVVEYPTKIENESNIYNLAVSEYTAKSNDLTSEIENFNNMKTQYDNISQEEIDRILEAYKQYKYDLEWLWVTLGNYASVNNLEIIINEPEKLDTIENVIGKLKLTVRGRYLDVVDFVFDVENDKELLFKLDNMKMTYDNNNKIIATFDILTMNVIF